MAPAADAMAEAFETTPPGVPVVPLIANVLAEVKGVNVEEVARATTENARRLFHLP